MSVLERLRLESLMGIRLSSEVATTAAVVAGVGAATAALFLAGYALGRSCAAAGKKVGAADEDQPGAIEIANPFATAGRAGGGGGGAAAAAAAAAAAPAPAAGEHQSGDSTGVISTSTAANDGAGNERRNSGQRIPRVPSSNSLGSDAESDAVGGNGQTTLRDNYRMVLVVRMDLKMAKNIVGAQLCHAALGQFKKLYKTKNPILWDWERDGHTTVVLRVQNEQDLIEVRDSAKTSGVPVHIVHTSAGNNASPNERARAVLAVGPAGSDVVGKITKHLRLW